MVFLAKTNTGEFQANRIFTGSKQEWSKTEHSRSHADLIVCYGLSFGLAKVRSMQKRAFVFAFAIVQHNDMMRLVCSARMCVFTGIVVCLV